VLWLIFTISHSIVHNRLPATDRKFVNKYSKHTVKILLIPLACFSRSHICVSRINSEDLRVRILSDVTQTQTMQAGGKGMCCYTT